MEKNLQHAYDEVDHDLAPEWTELINSLRRSVAALHSKAAGTGFEPESAAVSREANRLCDHVERLHSDVQALLLGLDEQQPSPEPDFTSPSDRPNSDEVQEEAIKIQRETHEMRADFKDVIKALFMWRDDPAARVKDKH